MKVIVLGLTGLWAFAAHVEGQPLLTEARRCSSIGTPNPIAFQGRTLVEIPDITDASLRRANLLLSNRCRDEALAVLERYVAEHGPDAPATYVAARFVWITAGQRAAETFIDDFIRTFPDFVSARVLMAGLYADDHRFDEAAALLDEAERQSPADLWIFLNRLRIAAWAEANASAIDTSLTIVHDAAFPPNARDTAYEIVRNAPNVPQPKLEEAMRGLLAFESSLPMDCKVTNYSFWLTEAWSRFDDARELLESYSGAAGACWQTKGRMYLAYVYLVEAADISPVPGPDNAALVERASALVDGDFSGLASFLLQRPQEPRLRPFIAQRLQTDAVDQYGRTRLCSALIFLELSVVRSEIERGADPNATCSGSHPVNLLLLMGWGDRIDQAEPLLRALLDAGARPRQVIDCTHEHEKQCEPLVPILREYGLL